jgi:pilus assembly protein CpaB
MPFRSIIVIVLAIVCGGFAAFGINLLNTPRKPGEIQTVPVLVVKTETPRGRLITEGSVEIQQWPKELAPKNALTKPEDAVQRAALQSLLPGEPIFDTKLAARGAIGGMASLIPHGKRAYTIQTKTAASNVAGFILPGNLVDVSLTFRGNQNDETGGGSATILLQAVEVLAVGGSVEPIGKMEAVNSKEVESVTLIVTPEQYVKLDLGQSLGILSLSMRNPDDKTEYEVAAATVDGIRFGNERNKPDQNPPAADLMASTEPKPVEPAPAPEPPKVDEVAAAPPPEPKKLPPKQKYAHIRTLRGQNWGQVTVINPVAHEEVAEPDEANP